MPRTIRTTFTTRTARFIALAMTATLPAFAVSAADEPAWLKEARAREGKLVDAKPFASTDGVVKGRAAAKLNGKVEPDEGAYYLEFDIGTDTPVSCEVLLDGFDAAQLLKRTAELTFEQLDSAQGKVDTRMVEGIDAGVIGANPYLAANWAYRTQTAQGPMLGGLKQYAIDMHSYGVYCAHVDLGYTNTFRTIVRTLVESLQVGGAAAAPSYVEVQTVKLGGQPVGIAKWTVTADEQGDLKSLISSSMLVPAGPGVVAAQDSAHVQWTTPDGELINAVHVMVANGETDVEVQLKRTDDEEGHWHAAGTFKGKPVEADFGVESPVSMLTQVRTRRDLLKSADPVGKEVSDTMWVAIDPTKLMPTTFKVQSKDASGRYTAVETSGPLRMESVMDAASGTALTTTMPLGAGSLSLERAYLQGSL
jgi:hypothetical protein